ncbi:MAG: hypothetical protein A2987_03910 [Omnitrophica bacterium RIFCSPLOWO2_01_FULL_45_10]|nr:MAG: hypothetical protein A2987_03910 [Omnitrophica bacterium RIFCSPLOWO2_01_FULL_45_10]
MRDRFMMDSHKLLWHLDRVNEWLNGGKIAPLHIDLGITTGCNMACSYCYGVLQGRTNARHRFDMPRPALIRLLKDSKEIGVRSIAFIGEGENTLNDALYDALLYARDIKLDVSLATNGLLLNKERVEDTLSSLSWLRFNISAASPSSFFKIHRIKGFDSVIENIRLYVEKKRSCHFKAAIGMQMVLTRENMDDIVPLAKLGRKTGVDYLVIKPCSDDPDRRLNAPEEYHDMEDPLKEAERLSADNYKVIVRWNKIKNQGLKGFKVCYGTHFLINISGDGSVFPCGHFFNMRRDEFRMGNIIETPLAKIVKSRRYWEAQKKICSIDVNRDCETNCRHYYVSQFLWTIKNPPEHVNFV